MAWALWGYHPDNITELLAAMWPLLLLLSLLLLGRGGSRQTLILAVAAITPIVLLIIVALYDRELFEVRYFLVAVPLLFLLDRPAGDRLDPNAPSARLRGHRRRHVHAAPRAGRPADQRRQPAPVRLPRRASRRSQDAAARRASCSSSRPTCATCWTTTRPSCAAGRCARAFRSRREGSPVFVLASFQDNKLFFDRTNKVVGQARLPAPAAQRSSRSRRPRSGSSDEQPPLGRPAAQGHLGAGADDRQRPHARAHHGRCSACRWRVWYFGWLLNPDRIGNPFLYGLLIVAELFNLDPGARLLVDVRQRAGARSRRRRASGVAVDVFIPVYKEPVDIVDLTVAAAAGLRGAEVRVWVLDDGNDDDMRDLAARHGVGYIRRDEHTGAKAGNINNALDADRRAVHRRLRLRPRGGPRASSRPRSGTWTTPRSRSCRRRSTTRTPSSNRIAAASWAQQALFFGAIARGKDGLDAVFCCGTNVLFRREAFESVGGFPTNSLTEDFELSIHLHEKGWKSAYVPDVLVARPRARGHGRLRLPAAALGPGLPVGPPAGAAGEAAAALKAQYLLSASYFLSGWTVLIYMSFPVIRLLFGGQPIAGITAPEFLLHFAPYFAVALTTAALAGAGSYTFAAFALAAANFWIHMSVHGLHGAAQGGLVRRDAEEGRRGPPAERGDARAGGGRAYWSRSASTA